MKNPIITNELIQSYDPCKAGIDNFNKYYPNYSDSMSNLLMLSNVSYNDKIWLAGKVIDYKIFQKWSVLCAEYVMHIYKNEYFDYNSVSECIRITKLYLDGKETLENLRIARRAVWLEEKVSWAAAWAAELTEGKAKDWASLAAGWTIEQKKQKEINLKILIDLLEQKGL